MVVAVVVLVVVVLAVVVVVGCCYSFCCVLLSFVVGLVIDELAITLMLSLHPLLTCDNSKHEHEFNSPTEKQT